MKFRHLPLIQSVIRTIEGGAWAAALATGLCLTLALLGGCARNSGEKISFNETIQPILSENCYHCHGQDSRSRKAELRLDRAEFATAPHGKFKPAIVPGKPDKSPLIQRVEAKDVKERMPPPETHKTLSPEQIAALRQWIEEGAEYQEHWAFIAPKRPALPNTKPVSIGGQEQKWGNSPIDRFILAKLQKEGLTPAPPADRHMLIRRVTYDLTGLPPTPEEVNAFVTNSAPNAYEKVVDRLLASPRYGEHRARYWLDVARYGDSHGLHIDAYRSIWPYRDYVIDAYNQNKPFDDFIREQIAGDMLPAENVDQIVATGFIRAGISSGEGGTLVEELRVNNKRERMEAFGAAFLGLTTGCAACHDHKFDPIKQREFYQLTAFLNNLAENPSNDDRQDWPPFIKVPKPDNRAAYNATLKQRAEVLRQIDARRAQARALVTAWLNQPATRPQAVPTEGLQVRLRFDEGKGDTFTNSAPGAEQKSVTAASGPVFWDEDVWLWPSLRLDTSTRIEMPQAGNFEADKGFSVGTWLMPRLETAASASPGFGAIVARADAQQSARGWELMFANGRLVFSLMHESPESGRRTTEAISKSKTLRDQAAESKAKREAEEAKRLAALTPAQRQAEKQAREDAQKKARIAQEKAIAERALKEEKRLAALTPAQRATEKKLQTERLAAQKKASAAFKVQQDKLNGLPDNAIRVMSKQTFMARGRWSHIFATYDGSGKAAGVKLYADGKPLEVEILKDNLSGSILSHAPLSLGRYMPDNNPLRQSRYQDFRVYSRSLPAEEAQRVAFEDYTAEIVRKPMQQWSEDEFKVVADFYLAERDETMRGLVARLPAFEEELERLSKDGDISLVSQESPRLAYAHILNRGMYNQREERVRPGVPHFLPPLPADAPLDRRGLAAWLVAANNPLTVRVVVNRMWHEIFGAGLVDTTEDFGVVGGRPSHPALLDWLAVEFQESGWDVKRLYKQLVMSATYGQAPRATPALLEKDPKNRLLARGPRFRMDAEMLRDTALAVSGLLVEKVGGPSVKPYQPPNIWESMAFGNPRYVQDHGEALYRRSMYTFWKRMATMPNMDTFDSPVRDVSCTRRQRTNTPLQALVVMNDPQWLEASRHLAERTIRTQTTPEARLNFLGMTLLAREWEPQERKVLERALKKFEAAYGQDAAAAAQVVEAGESKRDESISVNELAIWTLLANMVMNLDDALNK